MLTEHCEHCLLTVLFVPLQCVHMHSYTKLHSCIVHVARCAVLVAMLFGVTDRHHIWGALGAPKHSPQGDHLTLVMSILSIRVWAIMLHCLPLPALMLHNKNLCWFHFVVHAFMMPTQHPSWWFNLGDLVHPMIKVRTHSLS